MLRCAETDISIINMMCDNKIYNILRHWVINSQYFEINSEISSTDGKCLKFGNFWFLKFNCINSKQDVKIPQTGISVGKLSYKNFAKIDWIIFDTCMLQEHWDTQIQRQNQICSPCLKYIKQLMYFRQRNTMLPLPYGRVGRNITDNEV